MFARVLALPVRRVTIKHPWWRRAPERTVVQYISPDPAGFCPAKTGREHGDRGVIGVNPLAAHHVPAQGLDQRAEQTRRLTHHVGQGRAAEVDVLSRVLFRLPMQWLVIAVFRRQDMRDQAGAGAAPPDRQVGHRAPGRSSRRTGRIVSAVRGGRRGTRRGRSRESRSRSRPRHATARHTRGNRHSRHTGAGCSTMSRGNAAGRGPRTGLRAWSSVSSHRFVRRRDSASCSSISVSNNSSCSTRALSFSDERPKVTRSSLASRAFSASISYRCSIRPDRAAASSALCSSTIARSAAMSSGRSEASSAWRKPGRRLRVASSKK